VVREVGGDLDVGRWDRSAPPSEVVEVGAIGAPPSCCSIASAAAELAADAALPDVLL